MTRKVYKSAMGKTVDLGALILENENVRAVGNMGVNARGDVLDSAGRVIDSKPKQLQRQYKKQVVAGNIPITTSTRAAKQQLSAEVGDEVIVISDEEQPDEEVVEGIAQPEPVAEEPASVPRGGLAAALAKSQAVKQELMKTPRQLAQERTGVKKI